MNNTQYPDSMFNMRAMFYDQTKKQRKGRQINEDKGDPKNVRKLRKNFTLHQRPLTTSPDGS